MTRTRRPSEQAKALNDTVARLSAFADDLPTIVERLRQWAHGASATGSGPAPKNAISDPTGSAALAVDEWAMKRTAVGDLIDRAFAAGMDLEKIRRYVMDPTPAKLPEDRGLAKCANQYGCPDDAWGSKAGRCDPCYVYRNRTGMDRPNGDAVDG